MAPAPQFCRERHQLVTAFTLAVSEYNRIQSLQMEAIIKGEGSSLDADLAGARKRMDCAKNAVLEHERFHKCH